jgi:uncharacterized membrane protein (DUF4010 family)
MNEFLHLILFAKSLAIGLLIGLERERHPGAKAGLRTFTLIALAGTLFAYLGQLINAPWIIGLIAAVVGGTIAAAYWRDHDPSTDSGTTTVIAALLTFGLGATLWYGHSTLVVALAIVTMALLYFRTELHGATQQLSRRDYVSFLQFAVLAFILLPTLPDRTFDPFDAINPYRMGWLVVLISGVSLAGYVALRVFGARRGVLLAGVFGGLASTTATTLAFSRHAQRDSGLIPVAASVILVANLVLYLRIGFFVALIAPAVFWSLAPVLVGGLLCGGIYFYWQSSVLRRRPRTQPLEFDIDNPAEMRAALGFAALFSVVLLLVAWVNKVLGVAGVYAAAFVSGLTDMDAITLSTLRLANALDITPTQAAITIIVAFLANFIFKLGIAVVSGSRSLAKPVGGGFCAMVFGMLLGAGLSAFVSS